MESREAGKVSLQTLKVRLPHKTYPIQIGSGLLENRDLLTRYLRGKQALIVTNTTIAPFYLDTVLKFYQHIQADVLILPDGEAYKDQSNLFKIYDTLINKGHHRDTTLIALGGGVIGDLVGFAASTYQRGVGLIQLPTTLLSQIDASVGGKTAINYQHSKNMIGSFYQPDAVLIDVNTLYTLPARELNAGFGEVIKYALIVGGSFLEEVLTLLQANHCLYPSSNLSALILNCCRIKADFVQRDEHEQDVRSLLNLGHTFAHALEAITEYRKWLHGEAVGIGLYCAALLSYQLGHLSQDVLMLVDKLLHLAHLPRRIPADIDLSKLHALMHQDKKIKNNQLRFVIIKALGQCYLESNVTESQVRQVLSKAVKESLHEY